MTDTINHTEVQTMTDIASPEELSQERQDLLATLREHRKLFKVTIDGMSDEQAATRSTVSALTLGGLVKHVGQVEAQWVRFAVEGADAFADQAWVDVDWEAFAQQGAASMSDEVADAYDSGFSLVEGETLTDVLAEYDAITARTDELVASIDLDSSHPLPSAPWFEQGASWSARRVFLHILAEMSQHAGHADIIRESIDGAKTMG